MIQLQPSGAMTCRAMPGSTLDINTYQFLPPTTMSGFLRRLCMLSAGHELPETAPNTKDTPYYALPPQLIATGALPVGARGLHKTRRKGPSNFKHTGFSDLYRATLPKNENIQLHNWEYFFCEALRGYVVAPTQDDLLPLSKCLNWGCKIGKEGYAVVSEVTPPRELELISARAIPSTLFSPDAIGFDDLLHPTEVVGLYRYVWEEQESFPAPDDDAASPIAGYAPLPVAVPAPDVGYELEYWHDGGDLFIPTTWLRALRGEK